jgi:PAS domain S-box-containing protein
MTREEEDRMDMLIKQLEEKDHEIAKLNMKYDYLIEQSPLGIYKSSLDGKFLEMNTRLANMLGYNTSEEAIKAISDIANDIYVDKDMRSFKATQLLDTKEFMEYDINFIRKDGSVFTGRVIAKVIRDNDGNPKSFFGFIQDVSTRIRIRKELQESQDLFYTTFNNALDSNFIISLSDYKYIEVNKTFLRNTKTNYEDVIGKTSKDFGYFIFDEDMTTFKELLLNNQSLRNHVISINIENKRHWFSVNAIKIMWKGQPCAYISSREITEERQMTTDLKASENKFRSLVSNANLGIVIIQDLKVKYANPSAYKMFGYGEDEKIPVGGYEYVHPDDIQFIKDMYNQRIAGELVEADYLIRMLRKDKSTIHVNIRVTNIDWDGYPALLVFANDVTDNIKAKNDLKESEEKYKKIFQNIQDVYYELSLDGEILIVSPTVERITRINCNNLIGKKITDYYKTPGDRDKLINILLTKGYADDYEVVLKDSNGRRFMCSLSTSLVLMSIKDLLKLLE